MGKILIEKSGIFTEISGGSQETPQQLLAKILTVDGKGSGLDADLLGGVNYSQYALKKDYYDRNIINTELSKKLNISDYNNEKSTFALKTEVANSNKPVYVVSDTEPTDKNVFWIKDEQDPTDSIGKSIEDLKKYNDSNYNKIETLQNQIQELKKLLNKQGSGSSGSESVSGSNVLSQPRPNLLKNSKFLIGRNIPEKENVAKFGVKYPNTINYFRDSIENLKCYSDDYICDCWFLYSNSYLKNLKNVYISYDLMNENLKKGDGFKRCLRIKEIQNASSSIFIMQRMNDYYVDVPNDRNYGAIVSGSIEQLDSQSNPVDIDHKIYIIVNQVDERIYKSEKIKLDKEHIIEGKDGTKKIIKYNILENLPVLMTSKPYEAYFVIEISSSAGATNNMPIRLSDFKLELLQSKDDPKIPTEHTFYGGSYDTDLVSCNTESFLFSDYQLYSSQIYENSKHRLVIFMPNMKKSFNKNLTFDVAYQNQGSGYGDFTYYTSSDHNYIIFEYGCPFKIANFKYVGSMPNGYSLRQMTEN